MSKDVSLGHSTPRWHAIHVAKREQADRDESKNDREPKCGDADAYGGGCSRGQGRSSGCQQEGKRGFCRADATRKHRGGTHQHGNRIEGQCCLKWKKDVQLMKQMNTGKGAEARQAVRLREISAHSMALSAADSGADHHEVSVASVRLWARVADEER